MQVTIHDTVWIEDKPAPDGRLRLKNLEDRIVLTVDELNKLIKKGKEYVPNKGKPYP